MIDTAHIPAPGGRIFAPQFDLLAPTVTENKYFPGVPRLYRLPAYTGALEIVWWCRDWIGITLYWLIHEHQRFWWRSVLEDTSWDLEALH